MNQKRHGVLRDALGHLLGGLTLLDGARHPLSDVEAPRMPRGDQPR